MSALGNKAIMAKNIQYYMEMHNKTRNEMCEALGVKYTTFTDWVKGNSYPRIDKIELMANYFGISKADLVEEHTTTKRKSGGVSIPIISTIVAGMPADAYEDIIGYEEISHELARTGDFICLKVRGDSMSPVIQDGDLVIVRLQSDVDSGDIAVVRINGDEATLKKIQKSPDGVTLIAYNPNVYEPHFYSNREIEMLPVKVDGKVVEMKRTF